MKNPEIKASKFMSTVIQTLWEENRGIILRGFLLPNITYSLMMIFYICYYLYEPIGAELNYIELIYVLILAGFWCYLMFEEAV